jgi:peptidoglycan/xylan/chitin deacetylase (PgdA/CDA1 family)
LSAVAGLVFRLRALAARGVSASGIYRALSGSLGRVRGGFVLAYHNLPAERFIEQIEALAPSRPVSLDELVERHTSGRPTGDVFAITFDDGVGDTVRAIAAVASARQWPVSFYLPTAYLDAPGGMPFQWLRAIQRNAARVRLDIDDQTVDLSDAAAVTAFAKRMTRAMYTRPWAEYGPLLRRLAAALIERGAIEPTVLTPPAAITWDEVTTFARNPLLSFESHGVSHTAVAALSGDALVHELVSSRERITAHTGRPCRHFCYPYGSPASIGAKAPAEVARQYRSATTMSRGRLGRHDVALLPRVPVYPHDDAALVRLKVLTV